MATRRTKQIRRFARRLFGPPSQQSAAPPGNPAPPEIQVFQAKTAEIQHQKRGAIQIGPIRQWRARVPLRH